MAEWWLFHAVRVVLAEEGKVGWLTPCSNQSMPNLCSARLWFGLLDNMQTNA